MRPGCFACDPKGDLYEAEAQTRPDRISGYRFPRGRLSVAFWRQCSRSSPSQARPRQPVSSTGAKPAFASWDDSRNYVLAPDGGFEAGASGLEPWPAAPRPSPATSPTTSARALDRSSLSLPAGSSAGSPPVCMAIDTPDLPDDGPQHRRPELAAAGDGQLQAARPAPHPDAGHGHRRIQPGSPTTPQSTVLTLATIVGTLIPSAIEIRVAPLDSKGNWQIDDLYVDPFARR